MDAELELGVPRVGSRMRGWGSAVKKMAPGGGAKKEEFERGRWLLTVVSSNVGPLLVGPYLYIRRRAGKVTDSN
jgi:hypothetical protein